MRPPRNRCSSAVSRERSSRSSRCLGLRGALAGGARRSRRAPRALPPAPPMAPRPPSPASPSGWWPSRGRACPAARRRRGRRSRSRSPRGRLGQERGEELDLLPRPRVSARRREVLATTASFMGGGGETGCAAHGRRKVGRCASHPGLASRGAAGDSRGPGGLHAGAYVAASHRLTPTTTGVSVSALRR